MDVADILIVLGVAVGGSVVTLAMWVGMFLVVVRTHESYKDTRDVCLLGLIGAPVFIFLFYLGSRIWSDDLTWTEVVVWPLVTGWVFVVVLAGIHIAARIRGVLKPDSAT